MARPRRARLSPLRALLLLALAAAALSLGLRVRTREENPPAPGRDCRGLTDEECRSLAGAMWAPPVALAPPPLLSRAEACADAGYLCADADGSGEVRILRWPEETGVLRIWVPEPPHLPPGEARELQRAAVRGIQAWDGHPFVLAVRTRASGEEPDITVHWLPSLGGSRIGRARIEWVREGEEVRLRVLGLDLATQIPSSPGRSLPARELQLVAAHEMGHALGLPHSDDPRDVMYPQNTAVSLSVRDYRTLEALYSLPNGAAIRDIPPER